ncbi:MAG: sigma-70 family RNA polymerase sigma factor [Thermoanaerobaculia bacterium]
MSPRSPDPGEVTRLLEAWAAGDPSAYDELFPILYPQLKRIADRQLRGERPGHTLQPTALVHEAFLELAGQRSARFGNRAHFLSVAAFVMRRILVEHARKRRAGKRGGGVAAVAWSDSIAEVAAPESAWEEIAAVDEALDRLAAIDPRGAKVVVLRYFGGLSHEEIGEALAISVATVKREWTAARAWLRRELERG